MSETITIFSTNDIHGRFLGENNAIDFSRLVTLKKQTINSLLVDAGDATQGTPFAIMKMGLYPIQIMNQIGYDLMTVGNHEFDNITKDTQECELDKIIKEFHGTYLAANLLLKSNQKNYIYSLAKGNGCFEVKTVNNKNLLFVGVATPDMSMDIKRMEDFTIEPLDGIAARIHSAVEQATAQFGKIHAVIVISHLGLRGQTTSLRLAKEVPGIDLIIDGHSHDEYNQKAPQTNTYVVQAGCYGKKFSQISLDFDGDTLKSISCTLRDKAYLELQASQDTAVANTLKTMKEELERAFGTVWCSGSGCTLWGGAIEEDKPYVLKAINIARYAETNLGWIVSEAMNVITSTKRQEFNNKIERKEDWLKDEEYIIGAINGGALRDSIAFDKPIRNYELFTVLPSPLESVNESGLCVFRITLGELKSILKNSISRIAYSNGKLLTSDGRFLNVSGLNFKIRKGAGNVLELDDNIALHQKVNATISTKYFNLENDKEKTVLFCTTKYLGSGGDGYTVLKEKSPIAATDTALFQLVGQYLNLRSAGHMFYSYRICGNITYEGFSFPDPEEVEITLQTKDGALLKNETVVALFDTNSRNNSYRFLTSDSQGKIRLSPPKGNSILQLLVLMPFNNRKKGENLYCELYFHTYYMLSQSGALTACCTPAGNVYFPSEKLAVFHHKHLNTGAQHYSNYMNYINWQGEDCAFLIQNGQIYQKNGRQGEYTVTDHIEYLTDTGEKKTLRLNYLYQTWYRIPFESEILFE